LTNTSRITVCLLSFGERTMKIIQSILTCILVMLPANVKQGARGWRGIVPLHSTRADVERLLGPPGGQCKCIYKTENELISVEYASAPCKGEPPGWNVQGDTVLSLRVTPKAWQRFTDLNLDESKYVKTYDPDNPTAHYTNRDEGIAYTVTETGMVYYVSYIPSAGDGWLRCPGFPADAGGITKYRPFDKYSAIAFSDEKARLDNFAAALHGEPSFKGYIVVYAGRRARADEAQAHAARAKEYLVKVRAIEAERIVTIDGGHRDELEVELYTLPPGLSDPTPYSTVSAGEVQIINAGKAKNNIRPQ
jgi:hypothetical protein